MGWALTANVPLMVSRRSTKTVRSSPSRSSRWPPLIWLTWALAWSATLSKMFMTIRYFLSTANKRTETNKLKWALQSFFFFSTKLLASSGDGYWLAVSGSTDSTQICALIGSKSYSHALPSLSAWHLNCFPCFPCVCAGLPPFPG